MQAGLVSPRTSPCWGRPLQCPEEHASQHPGSPWGCTWGHATIGSAGHVTHCEKDPHDSYCLWSAVQTGAACKSCGPGCSLSGQHTTGQQRIFCLKTSAAWGPCFPSKCCAATDNRISSYAESGVYEYVPAAVQVDWVHLLADVVMQLGGVATDLLLVGTLGRLGVGDHVPAVTQTQQQCKGRL